MMTVSRQYSVTTTVIHKVASLNDGGPRTAPFTFEDQQEQLKFDGQFEDCVLSNVSSSGREGLFKNLSELEPLFKDGTFAKVRQRLETEDVVKVDLGTDRKWTATKEDDKRIEFRNGVSRLNLYGDRMVGLTVDCDLAKLKQGITGTYNQQTGTITVDSEQIEVTTGQV